MQWKFTPLDQPTSQPTLSAPYNLVNRFTSYNMNSAGFMNDCIFKVVINLITAVLKEYFPVMTSLKLYMYLKAITLSYPSTLQWWIFLV